MVRGGGKRLEIKRDESLPEQAAEWKPLPSTKEEFPSGCHPRMLCFPGEVCTLVSRREQCPCLRTAVPSPGSIWEPSGAYSSAPAALGSSSPASARHGRADGGASSHLLTSSSETHPHDTIPTPVCSAGACSPPSAAAEQQSIIKPTWRRSAGVGTALPAVLVSKLPSQAVL